MNEIPLPEARRLTTPQRDTLLRNRRRRDRQAAAWLAAELIVTAGCLVWVATHGRPVAVMETVLLVGVAVGGLLDWLPATWLANRKRLQDIRVDARFGPHTRDSLLACVDRVAARMGIRHACPVYLVRDKEINAMAVPASLLPGCGSLATVELNRAILHLLDERELEWVIGHELGHVFAFAPLSSRCLLIHLLFAGGLTLAIAGLLAGSELRYAAPLFALWPARRFTYATTVADIRGIEFLCDDAASAAVGVDAAARAQLKLAAEAEVRALLMDQVLEARLAGADLPLSALIATYEQALPYGSVDRAESEAAVRAGIERLTQTKGPSLIGLWRHLFTADDIDERAVATAVAAGAAVRSVARVSIPAQDVLAGRATVAACMAAIEDEPTRVLVHLPDEIDDRHDSHPNWSRRLLFLWRSQGGGRGTDGWPGRQDAH